MEQGRPSQLKKRGRIRSLGVRKGRCVQQATNQDIFHLDNELTNEVKNIKAVDPEMKRRLSHEMRPTVEAAGLMKPSFFTNHFDSDGEYISQTKKVQEPEGEPKKIRKHRRRKSEFNLKKYEGEEIYLGNARNQSAMGYFNGSLEEDTAIEVSSKTKEPKKEPKKEKKWCEASDKLPSPKKHSKGSKVMMNDDDFFFMENSIEKPVESNLKQYENFYLSQTQKLQKQAPKTSPAPQQQKQNIIYPSLKMLRAQKQITQAVLSGSFSGSFLKDCIPAGARLYFEAYVQSQTIWQREFTFWLNGELSKTMLMTAAKSMRFRSTQYIIKQFILQSNSSKFAARVENSMGAGTFEVSDDIENDQNQYKLLFGEIDTFPSINGRPVMSMYHPVFDRLTNRQKKIEFIKDSSYLKSVRSKEREARYLSYCQLGTTVQKKVMREHSLVKTRKTISLEDQQGNIKLYIGKIESKRYRIIAGSGISPLLIFAIFILMVES